MSCGPNPKLKKLQDMAAGAKEAFGKLTEGADGIMGSLDDLAGTLDAEIGKGLGSLKEMLPEIELPSLDIELPEINLPELPKIPNLSLQGDLMSLVNNAKLGDPGFLSEMKSLKAKYGDIPGVDFDKIQSQLLSGELNMDNLCKLVPNVEKTAEGETKEKGTPLSSLDEAAAELPKELPKIDIQSKLDEVAESAQAKLDVEFEAIQEEQMKKMEAELEAKFALETSNLSFKLNDLGI